MHYITPRVQDPELYVITDLLTTLRRLFTYYPALAETFIVRIREYQGTLCGPATTIAFYLKKFHWELTSQATLLGPGGLRLNLITSSTRQIKQQTRIAWDWYCFTLIQHRKGIANEPFDSCTVHKITQKMTDRQRRILALTMSAGWQSNSGLALWSATQSAKCDWCEQIDTHTHQLLHCPAFNHIRDQHPEAVTYMQDNLRVLVSFANTLPTYGTCKTIHALANPHSI